VTERPEITRKRKTNLLATTEMSSTPSLQISRRQNHNAICLRRKKVIKIGALKREEHDVVILTLGDPLQPLRNGKTAIFLPRSVHAEAQASSLILRQISEGAAGKYIMVKLH
jgi:hypothetical protein